MSELSIEDRKQRAFFLGLSAILGDGIYNFGELVSFQFANDDIDLNLDLFEARSPYSGKFERRGKWMANEFVICIQFWKYKTIWRNEI